MRFAIIRDGLVGAILHADMPFALDGAQYPSGWLRHAGNDLRRAHGIYPIEEESRPDSRFQNIHGETFIWNEKSRIVNAFYVVTDKDIDTIKTELMQQTNQEAKDILANSDWMVIRELETNKFKPIPESWAQFRSAIRNLLDEYQDKIRSCATIDELKFLVVKWPKEPV